MMFSITFTNYTNLYSNELGNLTTKEVCNHYLFPCSNFQNTYYTTIDTSENENYNDTVITKGTDYSQLFNYDTNDLETELFTQTSYLGLSVLQYEHFVGKDFSIKLSSRKQTDRRFIWGFNLGMYYIPNQSHTQIGYLNIHSSLNLTWIPIYTELIDITVDFEGGFGPSFFYTYNESEIQNIISTGLGSNIKISNNVILNLRTSLNYISGDTSIERGVFSDSILNGKSNLPLLTYSIGILVNRDYLGF